MPGSREKLNTNSKADGQPDAPYDTRVGRTGVTLIAFENVTFYLRPGNVLGVTVADFLGRGPESRFDRSTLTALRADPAGRCVDGSPARALTLHVAGRPPIVLLKRAPADATLRTAAYLCAQLGLPAPAGDVESAPRPPEPPRSPPRPDPLARRRRAERWLNEPSATGIEDDADPFPATRALPPLLPAGGNPVAVMEYATESTDDLLRIYRAPGAMRIIIPAPGWRAFSSLPGVIGAAAILTCIVVVLAGFPLPSLLPQLLPILIIPGLLAVGAVVYTVIAALDAFSARRIDVDAMHLTVLARRSYSGKVVELVRLECDAISSIFVVRSIGGWICQVAARRGGEPWLFVTGPVTPRQAQVIAERLRPAIGLIDVRGRPSH